MGVEKKSWQWFASRFWLPEGVAGEKAARDVRASLLLDKIADREAVGATQGEVDRKVQRIARQPGGRDSGRDGVNPQT